MMLFEPDVTVPRECPLCGYGFWQNDGHDGRALAEVSKATQAFEGHDARAHGGLLKRLASWFS